MKKWAIFLSGRGSNAEAFWENLAEFDVRLCVSSTAKAYGVLRARRLGIPTCVLEKKPNWEQLDQELRQRQVNQIFLLGFMKIVPAHFVKKWQGQIWNLHPSLLPDFPGLQAIEKSYAAGGAMGVSLHQVTQEMDAGPLSLQHKICDETGEFLSIDEAAFRISRAEQRLVRELAQRKNLEMRWN
ncbi:MAG: formyltransferase family protein [Pseudobdellovibrionaceae bacterium]